MRSCCPWGAVLLAPVVAGCAGGDAGAGAPRAPQAVVAPPAARPPAPRVLVRWTGLT